MITVYSKNLCPQCRMVKEWLKNNNLSYNEINVDENPKEVETIKSLGFTGLPVVVYDDLLFKGFDVKQLNNLKLKFS